MKERELKRKREKIKTTRKRERKKLYSETGKQTAFSLSLMHVNRQTDSFLSL